MEKQSIDELLNFINDNEDNKKEEKKKEKKEEKKEENEKEDKKEDKKEENEEKEGEKKKRKRKAHHKKKNHNENKKEEIDGIRPNPYRDLFNWKEKGIEINNSRFQDNSELRLIGNWEEKPWTQTNYPTKDIDELFPNKDWPVGIIEEYSNQIWRSNDKEKMELEKLREYDILSFRKGAECHRQIRKYAQRIFRPGKKLLDLCIELEDMLKFITNYHGIDCGQSFPTGCSLNHVAAHYTPNAGDDTVLQYDDVCKLDFGTHINGFVIDTAFTIAFNPTYDNLLKASKEATNQGIKLAGIDARLGEIGAGIQEVIESYEVEIKGKTYPIKPVKNLCGHTVGQYKVHAGKSVPIVKRDDNTKMEENEMYAIETFASTGKGYVREEGECSHYMLDEYASVEKIRGDKLKALYKYIYGKYNTLAWARRWLDESDFKNISLSIRQLIDQGVVEPYPPLADVEGCYVSQFEHTFMLKPTHKEIFTVGDDY